MRFSHEEIEAARRLSQQGLPWSPASGHYVFDEAGIIEQPSPFQERVYFILDLKHFLRRAGTVEELKSLMFWLPTWHDTRELLRCHAVPDEDVAKVLQGERALETGTELLTLYHLLGRRLARPVRPAAETSP